MRTTISKPLVNPLFFAFILAGTLLSKANADTTTVRTTTTTINPQAVSVPTSASLMIIDPITGVIKGVYDPATKLLNGNALTPGLVVEDKITGKIVYMVDAAGNIVDIANASANPLLISAINAKREELNSLINQALASGKITPSVASSLRAELDQIIVANTTGKTLSFVDAVPIANRLDILGNRIISYVPVNRITPTIASRLMVINGQLVLANDFEYRRLNLLRRVNDEYTAGRLSSSQVSKLKSGLDKIASLESSSTKNGVISERKSKIVSEKLDKTQIELDQDIAKINEKRAKIGIRVD